MNKCLINGIGLWLGLNACVLTEPGASPASPAVVQNKANLPTASPSPSVLFGCELPKSPELLIRCLPPPRTDIHRAAIRIEVFDDNQSVVAGAGVRVRSLSPEFPFDHEFVMENRVSQTKALDLPIGLTLQIWHSPQELLIANFPAGTHLEITAHKEGYLTRKTTKFLSRNNEFKFFPYNYAGVPGGDGYSSFAPPLSSKPEIDKVELIKQDKKVHGFVLHFSEPVERSSLENQFAIRAFYAYQESRGDGQISFERRYLDVKGTPIQSLGPIIFKKDDFNWEWNKRGDEVNIRFPAGKVFPTDRRSSVEYQMSLTALAPVGELRDLTGEIRREWPFMLSNIYFEKDFAFRIDADPTGPVLLQEKEPYSWVYPIAP